MRIDNNEIELIREFVYLRLLITNNNNNTEIKRRILLTNRYYFAVLIKITEYQQRNKEQILQNIDKISTDV